MVVSLDGAKVKNRRGLHKYLQRALALPDYYGKNLDALFDCLTDLHEDVELVVEHPEALEQTLGFYARSLNIVLRRASQENPHLKVTVLSDPAPEAVDSE